MPPPYPSSRSRMYPTSADQQWPNSGKPEFGASGGGNAPSARREHASRTDGRALSRLVGHARLGEGRHPGVTGERGAQHGHGERSASSFTEPHSEIEERVETKLG